jgi:hypothetical protein
MRFSTETPGPGPVLTQTPSPTSVASSGAGERAREPVPRCALGHLGPTADAQSRSRVIRTAHFDRGAGVVNSPAGYVRAAIEHGVGRSGPLAGTGPTLGCRPGLVPAPIEPAPESTIRLLAHFCDLNSRMNGIVQQLRVAEDVLPRLCRQRQHAAPEGRNHTCADIGSPQPQDPRASTVVHVNPMGCRNVTRRGNARHQDYRRGL